MRRAGVGLGLGLLLLLPGLAAAQDLAALLAFIEQHNSRLQAQRQILAAFAYPPPGGAEVLGVLAAEHRSWLKYATLSSGLGARVSPGDDGSGVDARIGLTVSVPLADYRGRLALARERQQQAVQQHTQQQQVDTARLAYATLREQLFATAATQLGRLLELGATADALQAAQHTKRQQRPLVAQRVETGVESREALWRLDDQLQELATQQALTLAQLRRVRLELALLAGDAWPELHRQLGGP